MMKILMAVVFFFLSGCQPEETRSTESYFLMHPHVLKKQMQACELQMTATPICQEAERAVILLEKLLDQRQENPEGFGKKVLLTQTAIVASQQEMLHLTKGSGYYYQALLKQNQLQKQLDILLKVIQITTAF